MHSGTLPRCLRLWLVCGLLLNAATVTADERPLRSAEQLLDTRGSLTLRDVTLSQALFTISESWNVNLLFGNSIEGSVNGVFRDATLREVLDSVLLANGYGYRPKGQSLIIMSLEQLGDSNAMLETESIPWSGPVTEDVIKAAELMLSPQGKLQPVAALRAVMVRDYPENVARIRQLLKSAAAPGAVASTGRLPAGAGTVLPPETVRILNPEPVLPAAAERTLIYLTPRHTTASALQEPMQSFLSAGTKVVPIESENRLVIVGAAEELALAQRIFNELDQPRGQVRITALIYDVNTEELERLGVNWTHNVKAGISSAGVARQTFGGKFGPFPDPAAPAFTIGDAVDAATTSTIGAARFTTLNRYLDVDAIVSALDSTDGARLLADPSVTVLDREEASIKIVTEVPIQQLTQTSEGGSIGTTSFREAGVTLTVTPQIGGDGTITMAVTPTFSVLTGFSDGQPIIDSREASTRVRIADRQTLVIGGLRQRSENENVSGIPGVMKWKHFGKLFRNHSTTVQESELIVFLRPEITTPTSLGTQREASALCVTQQKLNATNWPTTLPITPDCRDPYCPYHNPRPRFINPQQAGTAWNSPDPAASPTTAEDMQWPAPQSEPTGEEQYNHEALSDPFREAPGQPDDGFEDAFDNTFAPPVGAPTPDNQASRRPYDQRAYDERPYDQRPQQQPAPRSLPSAAGYPREYDRESSSLRTPSATQNGAGRVEESFGFIQPVSHEAVEQLQPPQTPRKKTGRFSWKWPRWYRPLSDRVGRSQ